jgi:hypothetical protein
VTTDSVPTWARAAIYGGAGAFGLLNLTVSSVSIGTLAHEHLNFDIVRSVALGLTPDAGALVAGTLWVACTGALRTWGRAVSLGLVAGSVIANAADVLASAGLVTAPILITLAVALAVAAPVLALLMLHLVLLVRATPQPKPSRARTPKREPKPKQPPQRDVTPPVIPVAVPNGESLEERTRRQARERQARRRARQRQEAFA